MSFRTYMSEVRTAGFPLGYFAQMTHEYTDLPDAKTWGEVESYLVERHTDPVEITSAAGYWRDYQACGGRL